MPGDASQLGDSLNYSRRCPTLSIRTLDVGGGGPAQEPAQEQKFVKGSPVLALLSTETDTQESWLTAGQGFEHVLLLACANGVSASFLNQVVEVDALRTQLRELLDTSGFPQALVRLGYGPQAKPTARRDISGVVF
jgi:hypothetical protein